MGADSSVCSYWHVSRRPDVNGSEEAVLPVHPAASLGRPPLEVVLRRQETSQGR